MQNRIIKTVILIFLSTIIAGCYSNYYQQGKIYEQREDYISAIEAYKKMAQRSDDQKRAIAQGEIGRLYVKLGKYWEAKEILEKAKKGLDSSDPGYATVRFNLGYCYYEIGDEWFNQAIAEFNEALKIKEDLSKAHFYLSVIYYRHKEYERALNHLTSVKDEHKVQAKQIAGMCYWKLSEYEKAANMIRKAVELEKDKATRTRYQETLIELMAEMDRIKREAEKIVAVDIKPVFASIYKQYAENPIGTAIIRNQTEEIMRDVKVILNVPSFMDEPTLNPVDNISPGGQTVVELKAAFNEKMREVQDDIENKPISLILEYTTNEGKKKESKQGVYFDIYDVNATNWKPNASIAAFVAHDNDTVQTIARYAANADNALEKAIQVYDTLNKYGIEYSLDPQDPYGKDIDYVMYPWETLKVKKGDCDDLSVLYAACLQNIGINTALVLTPSHVFVMFDSGMSASRASRVILDENLYRVEGKTAWIPVEVTMLGKPGKSFFDAWIKGKEEYNPDLKRVHISKAWKKFKPVWSGPEVEIELPDKNTVLREYYSDIAKAKEYWRDIIDEQIEYQLTQLKSQPKDNAQIRNLLGISYAMKGEFANAEKQLRKAALLAPSVTRYHNNLANVLLLGGRFQEAKKEYNLALQRSPDSAAVRVNMAIYYFAQQKPDRAQSVISESPDKEKLVAIAHELGIPVTVSPRAGDLETLIKDKTQKAAFLQEEKKAQKRLINQVIEQAMPDASEQEKQDYANQLSKLSIQNLQRLSKGKAPVTKDLVLVPKQKPEAPKLSPQQMKKLLDEALGSAKVSGTKATGISEPEDLQWWLSWIK